MSKINATECGGCGRRFDSSGGPARYCDDCRRGDSSLPDDVHRATERNPIQGSRIKDVRSLGERLGDGFAMLHGL